MKEKVKVIVLIDDCQWYDVELEELAIMEAYFGEETKREIKLTGKLKDRE